MTIKHLVISGGGPIMIQILGSMQHLENNRFFNISDIESIYGTSAGAIVAVLIALKYDWDTIVDYIIKRPWKDVFHLKIQNIFDAYNRKGIFDVKIIEKCFKPLFDAKDIPLNITLSDFYKLTNIDIHMFTFEINQYCIHDVSHKTHPDLKLMTAIQMTCGIPILMTPVILDDKCFIDGGIECNYPLNHCIESGKCIDEILSFKNKYNDTNIIITESSSLLDFILNFIFKAVFSINKDNNQTLIKNELICSTEKMSFNSLKNSLSDIEIRKSLFNDGIECAKLFLSQYSI